MYSTAEAVLGDLLTPEQQAKVFIATKVWTPGSGGHGEQKGIEQMQRSMALLRHKRIELMQVHNLVDLDAHLKTLRRWKAEGRSSTSASRTTPASSYPDLIAIIEREKLDFVQFNYSVTTREAEKRLLPLCADKGVAVIVNRAFEDGNLFARVQGKPLPRLGRGVRREELGAGVPQIRAGASRRDLRDPGHRQAPQPGRQPVAPAWARCPTRSSARRSSPHLARHAATLNPGRSCR